MNRLLFLALPALALSAFAADPARKPLYSNDFEAAAVGKAPEGFLITAGVFTVQKEGANGVLELPGEPLDTFGALFGPAEREGLSVSLRCFGTKEGRKFPTFGVSLNGAGGYRLQVSPGKKALEIFKGDEPRASVPFGWVSGAWTWLRLQVRQTAPGVWVVEGKAWPAEGKEPAAWMIALEEKDAPTPGRAGLWGSPFSGTPIRFDDVLIVPAH